jgi:GNAT superfamily N-acetyltransferase
VYQRRLGARAPAAPPPGLACRRLGEAELISYCADPELELHEEMVFSGNTCIGAFSGGELAGYAWFAYEDAPHVNGVRVRVPAQAIYRFKTFVRPAWRGRGVAPFLYRSADGIVARPGRSCVVNCIAVQNRASVAASRRSGDALLGYLAYWQAGSRFLALHTPEVEALGLRFHIAPTRRGSLPARMASRRTAGSGSLQEKRS